MVYVQVVVYKKAFLRSVGLVQHGRPDVRKGQSFVFLREVSHQVVGSLHCWSQMPTLDAWFDGDEHNFCAGQGAMDGFGKETEVSKNSGRVFAVGNVVVAGVEEDCFRFVGKDDAIGEEDAVDNVGASESAVEDGRIGEIGGQ